MDHQSFAQRARTLVGRMTTEEKAFQLRFDAPAIERLGIPEYNWWNEALHGVARAGTATMFPQAIGLAAMFDADFLCELAGVIATEGRAKYNMYAAQGDRDIYKGLTFWSPNVNIFRDPRWGRGQETYGEDPFLTSRLGVAFVEGLQQLDKGKYMKTAACAKHFAVHSGPESLRHEFDAQANPKDMAETYLPAFKALVEAGVESVMGAYNCVNGEPCCGSKTLLHDILREQWGFMGHVVSDCWAICDFHLHHKVTDGPLESVALALKNGCDLNCGNSYERVVLAYEQGLITEEEITEACVRLFTTRMKLGLFDSDCEYDQIPYGVVESSEHLNAALSAARKSMVLLKNEGFLPLDPKKIKSAAVIGPTADSREILKGNYCGTSSRYITLLAGIQQQLPDARIYYSEGCHLFKDRIESLSKPGSTAEAVGAAEAADVVFLCLGLDATIEGEAGDTGNSYASGDKPDLLLPAPQRALLDAVLAVGKPTVLLLSSGSALDVSEADEHPACKAILQTWYCGNQGGLACAQLLFGEACPSGKLPITFYKNSDPLPDFCDYSMKNRTYRFMENEALYPFGFGLSYAKVEYSDLTVIRDGEGAVADVTVKNLSDITCEEVAQVYVKINGSLGAPRNHSLCAFQRVDLAPGESRRLSFSVAPEALMVVNEAGERVREGGSCAFYVGGSQPDSVSVRRTGAAPLSAELPL